MKIPLQSYQMPTTGYYLCIGYRTGENSYETDVIHAVSGENAASLFRGKYSHISFTAIFTTFQSFG